VAAALDGIIAQRDAADWLERWRGAEIPASKINNLAELAEDPQAWENRYLVDAYSEEVQREVKIRGLPVYMSKTPGEVRHLGPELGQHTEEILVETLGYSWEDVVSFKEQGVIP
jgi:crotonobetainyl-CoA:carnitine CoA-transferase CaiB-like acyl-CoA transferase